MNLSYESITAWAAIITALVAIYAVWVENRRSSFRHGVDLLEKFNSRFDETDFRKARRVAAEYLYSKLHHIKTSDAEINIQQSETSTELEQVLDFFQYLAVLTRRKVIDMDLVWNQYVYYLDCYFKCAEDYIAYWRQTWPDTWDDIDWLHKCFIKIENRQSQRGYTSPSIKKLDQFLDDERNLNLS